MNEYNIIVFSGGFDSTLVLYNLLNEGKDVITVEIEVDVSYEKVNMEREARDRIINYLSSKFYDRQIKRNKITINSSKSVIKSSGLAQPLFWVPSALLCTEAFSKNHIYFGYIQNDQTNIEYIKGIVKSAEKLQPYKEFICEFPLLFTSKEEVLYTLIENEPFLFENATTCENAFNKDDFCGDCKPCKHLISALLSLLVYPDKEAYSNVKKTASKYLLDKYGISANISKKNTENLVEDTSTMLTFEKKNI